MRCLLLATMALFLFPADAQARPFRRFKERRSTQVTAPTTDCEDGVCTEPSDYEAERAAYEARLLARKGAEKPKDPPKKAITAKVVKAAGLAQAEANLSQAEDDLEAAMATAIAEEKQLLATKAAAKAMIEEQKKRLETAQFEMTKMEVALAHAHEKMALEQRIEGVRQEIAAKIARAEKAAKEDEAKRIASIKQEAEDRERAAVATELEELAKGGAE